MAYLDEALALLYLRALPYRERVAVWRQARAEVAAHLPQRSPRARRAALRAYRVLHARAHGGLPTLA